MKIETVRKIDYWVGIPLCFVLSGISWVGRKLFPGKTRVWNRKKFLFIELSEMGSAILAYPTIKALQRAYPEAEFFFMIFERNRASVDILNLIPEKNVLAVRDRSIGSFLTDILKALYRLRRERLDVAFDLELFTRVTAVLTYLSGAPVRVGFHKYRMEGLYRGNLHTHKVQYNFQQHIAKSFLSFMSVLHYPVKDWPALEAPIPDGRLETADYPGSELGRILVRDKIKNLYSGLRDSDRIFVLNPSAGEIPIRAWPLENYAELTRRLLLDPDRVVVLMGARVDRNTTVPLAQKVQDQRCVNLAGETNFEELMDLFSLAEALVTNDSGPAHFASLTGIPNFVFMGPESPRLYGPLGENTRVLYAAFPCSPCLTAFNHRNTPCLDNKCLQAITVDEVQATIEAELGRPGKASSADPSA